jgi:hypothetical protein
MNEQLTAGCYILLPGMSIVDMGGVDELVMGSSGPSSDCLGREDFVSLMRSRL